MTLLSLFHLDGLVRTRAVPRSSQNDAMPEVIRRAAAAVRRGELDLAEWLLSEHGEAPQRNAGCLNLLAVIAVAEGKWSRAKHLWRRAYRTDPSYQPVLHNIRRHYELYQFGKSHEHLWLGDEPEFQRPSEGTV